VLLVRDEIYDEGEIINGNPVGEPVGEGIERSDHKFKQITKETETILRAQAAEIILIQGSHLNYI
jgi:hypothetical protein